MVIDLIITGCQATLMSIISLIRLSFISFIFIGIVGVVFFSSITRFSSLWFPKNQRTTATGNPELDNLDLLVKPLICLKYATAFQVFLVLLPTWELCYRPFPVLRLLVTLTGQSLILPY